MQKDIEIPTVKNVRIVAVKEWDKDFTGQQWNVYLVNNRNDEISTVLVMSRGNNSDRKTSTLRHSLGNVAPNTTAKIELIPEDLFTFTNEYLITFFAEDKLFEKKFRFEPQSISEEKTVEIPVIGKKGILAQ